MDEIMRAKLYLALNGTRGAAVVVPGAFETVVFVAEIREAKNQ